MPPKYMTTALQRRVVVDRYGRAKTGRVVAAGLVGCPGLRSALRPNEVGS
jgi:hypothetical protein